MAGKKRKQAKTRYMQASGRLRAIRGCPGKMLHVRIIISGCVSNIWEPIPLLANWSTVTPR